MKRFAVALLFLVATAWLPMRSAGVQRAAPTFRIETDEFWLNLHHFLYVLGRSANNEDDATREAVASAKANADSGLALLTVAERQVFEAAIAYYAAGWSKKNLIFDAPLPSIGGALERADNAPSLASVPVDSGLARALESAAPAYRKAWWPSHQRGNVEALAALRPLIDRHGPAVLSFITQKYGLPWPSDGFPVHFSGYSNWSGAYSTSGNLLVVSSRAPYSRSVPGLEILFHESMHQWDDTVFKLLRTHARALGGLVPGDLSHAMIFFTAGDALRREVPGHTPYGETAGVWNRGLRPLREALIDTWKPYLDGQGTRDEALAALVRRTLVRRNPGP